MNGREPALWQRSTTTRSRSVILVNWPEGIRPTRARQAHVRAHGRMPTRASGPVHGGGARECEASRGERTGREQHAEKTAWPFRTEIFMTNLNIRLSSYLFTIRPFVVPRKR
ncbi:MAG: hypothetical protein ACYDHX_17035 [Methanothrix sp.]